MCILLCRNEDRFYHPSQQQSTPGRMQCCLRKPKIKPRLSCPMLSMSPSSKWSPGSIPFWAPEVNLHNQTVASHLTANMRRYHNEGTIWSSIDRIVETPLFVDSHLTSMVQVADLCAVAIRRFCEKDDRELWERIKGRIDKSGDRLVGIRHYTGRTRCTCEICREHGRYP